MLIKCYLNNYNGVIKATLSRADSAPWGGPCRGSVLVVIRSGCSGHPVLSTELQPPRALYQHLIPVSICLKMAANAGSMFQYWKRFDLQQLQVSGLSVTAASSAARFGRVRPSLVGRVLFFSRGAFRRLPRSCFVKRIQDLFLTLMKVALSRWSEIDPLCSIQHRSDTLQQAEATPRGCAETKSYERRGLWRKAFGWFSLLVRVVQLLPELVAVVSPDALAAACKVG